MGNLKQTQTVFIDNEADLNTSWADGIQVYTKDTNQFYILDNGAFVTISSGTTNNPEGWTTLMKTANQDITNQANQNDDTLFFSTTAGGMYMVEAHIVSSTNVNNQAFGGLSVDAGSMSGRGSMVTSNTAVVALTVSNASGTTISNMSPGAAGLDSPESARMNFSFYCTNSTTFRYKFGNQVTATGRISRTMKGSILKYKKIN